MSMEIDLVRLELRRHRHMNGGEVNCHGSVCGFGLSPVLGSGY